MVLNGKHFSIKDYVILKGEAAKLDIEYDELGLQIDKLINKRAELVKQWEEINKVVNEKGFEFIKLIEETALAFIQDKDPMILDY